MPLGWSQRDGGHGGSRRGFTNAYNIIDGFEGDKVDDPTSPDHGKRRCNGWTNAGLPWTYDVDPERMRYRQPVAGHPMNRSISTTYEGVGQP